MLRAINRGKARLSVCQATVATRAISISSPALVKEIQIETNDDKTIIFGKTVPSPNQANMINLDLVGHNKEACPLCRLNLPNLTYKVKMKTNFFLSSA